ncbi:MAG: helix-turn-helix transcriptional regulator [Terracoccus sp.]
MTPLTPLTRPTPLLRDVFGALLRRRRQRQGRTLAEVAAAAGISVAYLSELERGLKEPSSEMIEAVCVALGSSIVDLLGSAHHELRELATSSTSPGTTGQPDRAPVTLLSAA